MIQHVVMFKMRAFNSKDEKLEILNTIKSALELLPSKIKQIKSFDVGINIIESDRAFDLVLISTFNSIEDLKIYSDNTEHQIVAKLIRTYSEKTFSVDCEK